MQVPFGPQDLISLLTLALLGFFFTVVLCHIVSNLFLTNTPLKLSNNSFVVITGGCMGIGKQMALEIAKLYHCTILIVDYRKDLFDDIHEELQKFGAICECRFSDLSSEKSVEDFIEFLKNRSQKIDLFIHNAGIVIPKKALETSEKQLKMQHQVNFYSPVKIMKQTIKQMQGGHLAVVSSIIPLAHGGINVSAYSSSKAAMYNFVNSFRQELKVDKQRKVTISMACPYMIKTGMFKGFRTKLDFIFRPLEMDYVGKRLVKEFVEKKQISYVYQYEGLLFRLFSLLPTYFLDEISIRMNISNFNEIKSRHDDRVKEVQ